MVANMSNRQHIFDAISKELDYAYTKHSTKPWSRHEFYAILLEEVDEMWDDIKSDAPQEQLLKEIIQVAAMAVRYLETGDATRGNHPTIPIRL